MGFLSGWTYRKKISIDNTKIDSTLTDFIALVELTDSNFDFDKAEADGSDIRFTSDDETTLLDYDREAHVNTSSFGPDICTGGTSSASSESGAEVVARAFDDNITTFWTSLVGDGMPQWAKYDLGSGVTKTAEKFSLRIRNSDSNGKPADFKLQGSNDDSAWTDLHSVTGETWSDDGPKEYTFTNSTAYRYYRLNVTATGTNSYVQVKELEIFENVPEVLGAYFVKIPSVSSSVDTDIYIYYGNASTTDGESESSVWVNYNAVYHLAESGVGTVGEFKDATSNNNDGQGKGTVPTQVDSVIYKGQDGAGTSSYIEAPDSDDFYFSGDFSINWKMNWPGSVSNGSIMGQSQGGGSNPKWFLNYGDIASGKLALSEQSWDVRFTWSPSADTDYHCTMIRTGNDFKFYVDGVQVGGTQTNAGTFNNNTQPFNLFTEGESWKWFSGILDEVRITKGTALSADYIKAEYNSDSIQLLSFATEELFTPGADEPISLTITVKKTVSKTISEAISLAETSKASVLVSQLIVESLSLSENVSKSLALQISESLDLGEFSLANADNINQSVSEGISLTEVVTATVVQEANQASRVIRFNPLMFVTNTDPAKIVKVDISDPENPTHTVFTLTGAKYAMDIARNSVTGFLYIACADGLVVKVDETNLNTQTIINLSDTDDLQTIEVLENFNITYTSTDSSTGELYLLDERTTVVGDFRLDVLSTQEVLGEFQFNSIQAVSMESDFTVLSIVQTGFGNMDFKCLDQVIDTGSSVSPLDQITPIKKTDFVVFLDGVQLNQFDVDLSSITITHNIDEESVATFNLCRRHDEMDFDLDGNSKQITNQNAVKITIQGRTEIDGFISNLNCQYGVDSELISVTVLAIEKASSFNNVTLSLPDNNSRLGLYDILVQNPEIFNPVIDPLAENPKRFKGIKVNLGEKRVQNFSRWTVFDAFGSIAESIQDGSFIPRQNWTYFWGPTVEKFQITEGLNNIPTATSSDADDFSQLKLPVFKFPTFSPYSNISLGDTSAIRFLYIGTSLSPVSEDLWILTNAQHRRQRQFDDIITELGEYTVGVAPFKEIKPRNGVYIPKFSWRDEPDGLYSVKEAGYNFEDYAKQVADLEYQKLLNINGDVLPETSCTLNITLDGYYFYALSLLNRLNVDNTTTIGIYKNLNGFPVSIKSISISSSDMKCSLTCDNLKSNQELEAIDGLFPDEDSDDFNTSEKHILQDAKSDMKTRLEVA